jgi:hypothetical protein
MQYPQFRAQGWPIGSGIVESANKLVVQARLKGPGMHWERTHINPLLALRLAVCNERWSEMWRKALTCRSRQVVLPRSAPIAPASPSAPVESTSCASALQTGSGRRTRPTDPKAARLHGSPQAARPLARGTAGALTTDGWCGRCGTPVIQKRHARGHRPRVYCSPRCRVRAYRARGAADLAHRPLPDQLTHQVLPSLASPAVPRRPFVKERADLCPCGMPVVSARAMRGVIDLGCIVRFAAGCERTAGGTRERTRRRTTRHFRFSSAMQKSMGHPFRRGRHQSRKRNNGFERGIY